MIKIVRNIQAWSIRWSNKVHIPKYKNVTLYNVAQFYIESLKKGKIGERGASISFRFLTAMFPLCIFLFSVIPFIPIEDLQDKLFHGLKTFFPPQIFVYFEDVLEDLILRKHGVLMSVGFVLSLYFASNAVNALISGLTASHHVSVQHIFWKQRLWSIALLIIFFLLFILSFVVTSVGQLLIDYLYNHNIIQDSLSYWLFVFIKATLSVLIFMMSISVLYNVANTEKIKWKFFNAGAITSTFLIILLKQTFGLYLTYFGKFDQVYGPIGAALAFLIFIFYIFVLLIIGFELNMSLQKAYDYKNQQRKSEKEVEETVRQQLNE